MPVVARFYVAEIKRTAYAPGAVHVTLQAVSRGPENKEWAEATPSGSLQMMIKNSPAAQFFGDRLGKDIAITFEAAEDDQQYPTQYTDVPSR